MTDPRDVEALIAELRETATRRLAPSLAYETPAHEQLALRMDVCSRAAAALEAAKPQEAIALWMIARSYATGHGDTVECLLNELEAQARERCTCRANSGEKE